MIGQRCMGNFWRQTAGCAAAWHHRCSKRVDANASEMGIMPNVLRRSMFATHHCQVGGSVDDRYRIVADGRTKACEKMRGRLDKLHMGLLCGSGKSTIASPTSVVKK